VRKDLQEQPGLRVQSDRQALKAQQVQPVLKDQSVQQEQPGLKVH
jgi:hypothetical protein